MKKLPIGRSDFRQIRLEDNYYIDKSLFIEELMSGGAQAYLFPRPRRFGKTLNMSMLYYFFDIDHADENKDLFKGLAIENSPAWAHQGKYPVIFLTFKELKQRSFDDMLEALQEQLGQYLKKNFSYLLSSDELDEFDKSYLKKINLGEARKVQLQQFLQSITAFLHRHHGIAPIILIDEYDAPIHASYENDYLAEMLDFMRNFLSAGFKDNEHLTKGVITGILRVAKENIFSGLNNIATFSILNEQFSSQFGLTEREVSKVLNDTGFSGDRSQVDDWYKGYTFGKVARIYNPWSILNFIFRDGELSPYWVNTSSNELIQKILPKADKVTQTLLFDLLEGKSVETSIDEFTVFEDLYKGKASTVFGLLLFSGYLTTAGKVQKEEERLYHLQIPNKEIKSMYKQTLKRYLKASDQVSDNTLLEALLNQQFKTFADALQRYLLNSFSFFDIGKNGDSPEKVYHAFMLGLMAHLSGDYHVKSNREMGFGRSDLMICPKDPNDPKAWILEFKKKNLDTKGTLEELAQNALDQIKEKQYMHDLQEAGHTEIFAMGIAFDGKKVACAF